MKRLPVIFLFLVLLVPVFASVTAGDTLTLGRDRFGESVEWTVLAAEDGRALVISRDILCYAPYNDTYSPVTWESCSLRAWLNGPFLSSFFTEDEASIIMETTTKASSNPKSGTDGGEDTTDRVFLLSMEECEEYFPTEAERKALYNGGADTWTLRTPGRSSYTAAEVRYDGFINTSGSYVDFMNAVRPAMWINTTLL